MQRMWNGVNGMKHLKIPEKGSNIVVKQFKQIGR